MSGWGNLSGVAYQQAHAVLTCLTLLEHESAVSVQVESAEDAYDLELRRSNGEVLLAKQIKNRQLNETWAQGDIYPLLRRWAGLERSADTRFELVLGGRLGPTGTKLMKAVQSASDGDTSPLENLARSELDLPEVEACRDVQITIDATPAEGLISAAIRQAMSLIQNPRTGKDAESEAKTIVHQLYQLAVSRASAPEEHLRVITRDEVSVLFGFEPDYFHGWTWGPQLRQRYVSAVLSMPHTRSAEESLVRLASPIQRSTGSAREEYISLTDLLEDEHCILLAGQSGSGKSTAARTLRNVAARSGTVVAIANAASYLPGRLDALVADALTKLLERPTPTTTGRGLIRDHTALLIIDGVAELPDVLRDALADEIRVLLATECGCKIALIGRDAAILNSIPPATSRRSAFLLRGITRSARADLVREVLRESRQADDRSVQIITAQAEHALKDAAGVPYLLRMAAALIDRGFGFDNRAQMYSIFVEEMAKRTGVIDVQISLLALGITFAEMLDHGRRQCDQFDWKQLLHKSTQIMHSKHVPIEPQAIESVALKGGFIAFEDYMQIVTPAHDSLADFFAAMAHSKDLVALPNRLTTNDSLRTIFLSELFGVNTELSIKITTDLPFVAVSIAENDVRPLDESSPKEAFDLLCRFTPVATKENALNIWKTPDGKNYLILGGTRHPQWISNTDGAELMMSKGGLEFEGGPLSAAVAGWKRILSRRLTKSETGWRIPDSVESAVDALHRHSNQTRNSIDELVADLLAEEWRASVRDASMPGPLSIVVHQDRNTEEPFWPILFRTGDEKLNVEVGDFDAWECHGKRSGWGSIDSILRKSPLDTARDLVKDAINQMVDTKWLD